MLVVEGENFKEYSDKPTITMELFKFIGILPLSGFIVAMYLSSMSWFEIIVATILGGLVYFVIFALPLLIILGNNAVRSYKSKLSKKHGYNFDVGKFEAFYFPNPSNDKEIFNDAFLGVDKNKNKVALGLGVNNSSSSMIVRIFDADSITHAKWQEITPDNGKKQIRLELSVNDPESSTYKYLVKDVKFFELFKSALFDLKDWE